MILQPRVLYTEIFDLDLARDLRAQFDLLTQRLDELMLLGWDLTNVARHHLRPLRHRLTMRQRDSADRCLAPTCRHRIEIHRPEPGDDDYRRAWRHQRSLNQYAAEGWKILAVAGKAGVEEHTHLVILRSLA